MPTGRGTGDVRMAWKKGRKDNEYDVNFKAGWGRSNHRRLGSTIPPSVFHPPRDSHTTHPRGLWTLTLSNYRSTFSQVETRVLCSARQHPLTRLDLAPRGIRRGNVEKKEATNGQGKKERRNEEKGKGRSGKRSGKGKSERERDTSREFIASTDNAN